MNISTCMAVLNNIELTKSAYHHFRRIYPAEELCISVNHDEEIYKWIKEIAVWDMNLKYAWTEELLSYSDNYNKAVSLATKDKIVLYHNDSAPAPNFLETLDKNEDPMVVLGYTTVEPPIFTDHVRPGKVLKDFGADFSNFKQKEFEQFAQEQTESITDGVFFFLSCYKSTFDAIGGFDGVTFYQAFCEDSDFIARLLLYGCTTITTNMAMVYHFVSKTSRFSDDTKTLWKDIPSAIEINSLRNFIRKWGCNLTERNKEHLKVFDIGYNLKNSNLQMIRLLEPNARNLKVDSEDVHYYIDMEQSRTPFDLKQKFVDKLTNDIIVDIDCNRLNQHSYNQLIMLPLMITTSMETGKFQWGEFIVTVTTPPKDYANTLIFIKRN